MITDVVVVPGAPLLLVEYQGRTAAAAGLLESCVAAVTEAVAHAAHVIVVHASDREPRSTRPPIGLRVADQLLAATHLGFEVEHVAVPWDAPVADCVAQGRAIATAAHALSDPATLLVVADGSARRSEKAPGHLDERAAALDASIVDALRDGAAGGLDRLLDLDPTLCAELLVAGRAPLQTLAATVRDADADADGDGDVDGSHSEAGMPGRALRVESCEVSDPFGVLYVVAHLTLSD